ncbi:hypothetical protein [Pseudoteredinibacter isoporae]|uniref:hypothetical protein n=1 Tax=Pseudoteredinibacter isoporae TaxID=570281 RepID=UPI0031036791
MTKQSTEQLTIHWDNPNLDAESIIRELAKQHALKSQLDDGDRSHSDLPRIVGEDVTLDDVEKLLVNIAKLQRYRELDISKLHARYLRELKLKQNHD